MKCYHCHKEYVPEKTMEYQGTWYCCKECEEKHDEEKKDEHPNH